jgi:hypothetical protein
MKALVEQEVSELVARLGRLPEEERPWAIARFTSMLGRQEASTVELFYQVLRERSTGPAGAPPTGGQGGSDEVVGDLLESVCYVRESRL